MAPATKHVTADAPVDTNRSSNSPPVHPTDSCPVNASRPLSPGVTSCRCGATDDAGNIDDDAGDRDGTENADDEDDDEEDDEDDEEEDEDDDDVECATVYSCRSTELSTGPHPTTDSPPCLPADIASEEMKEVKVSIDDLHQTHQAFKDDHTHGGLDMSTLWSQPSTTARGRSLSLSKDRHPKTSFEKFGSRPTSCAGDHVVYRVLNDKEFTLSAVAKMPPGTAKTTAMVRSDGELLNAPCAPCVSDLHIKRYAAGDRRPAQDTSPISTSPMKKNEGKPTASPMKKKTDQLENARSRSLALACAQPEAPGVTGCIEKLPGAHITAGTKAGQKSFWISSTRSLRVAAGWAHKSLLEAKAASSPAKKSARETRDETDDVKKSTGPAVATAIIARIQLPEEIPATAHQIGEKVFPRVLDYSAFCKTTRDEVVKSNAMDSLNGTCPVKDLVDGLGGTAFSFMKSSQEVLIHGEIPTAWVTGLYRVELPTSGSGAHSSQQSVSSPSHAEGSDSSAQPQLPLPTKGHPVRLEVYTSSAFDKATLPAVVLSDAWGLNVWQSSSSSSSSPASATPVLPDTYTSNEPMLAVCSSPASPLPSGVATAGIAAASAFICEHCGRHDFATKKSCTSHKGHCKENPKRRA